METQEEKLTRWAQEEARDRERTRKRRATVQLENDCRYGAADAGRRHHCFHAGVNGQPKRELAEKSSAMTEMMRAAEEKKSENL